jgi:hypothetical protein
MKLNKTFIPAVAILVLLLAGILSGCVPPVPEVINVTGVSITEDDQSMKVDDTLQLTTVVTPEDADNKNITWVSDNPDVATVSEDGLVTALKTGVANITVTTEDGAFTDSVKITVTKPYTPSAPAIKKYEVSFGVILIPEEIPAGLTSSRGDDPEPNLAGVEIEIFSDEARTDRVTTITTDENGMATAKVPNGTYYFIANRERYICAPFDEISDENYEVITLPTTPVATLTVQGSFTISNEDISDTILIIARGTYIVTFEATEGEIQSAEISRISDPIPPTPLEDVIIEIYLGGDAMGISTLERTAEESTNEFKITTLTTNSDGIARVYLPESTYNFNASKKGYAVNSDDFKVDGADITDTDPIQVPMKPIYTVNFKVTDGNYDSPIEGAQISVFSDSEKNISIGTTQTTDTNGEATLDVDLTGGTTYYYTVTADGYQDNECSFTTPAEDVTVTVTLEDAGCLQAGYIYNGSDYADDWMIGVSSTADHIEFSKDGEFLYLKAFQIEVRAIQVII